MSVDRPYSLSVPIQATPLFLWCRKILQIPTRYNVANWRFYVETEQILDHFEGFSGIEDVSIADAVGILLNSSIFRVFGSRNNPYHKGRSFAHNRPPKFLA